MKEAERKLAWVCRFVSAPLPEREAEWRTLESEVTRFYGSALDPLPLQGQKPLPMSTEQWRGCIRRLDNTVRMFLQSCYANVGRRRKGAPPPSAETAFHVPNVRGYKVEGGRVVVRHRGVNSEGAFLLTLGDLLASQPDLGKIQRCDCGAFFYKVKRQEYCSEACKKKAHPSRDRTEAYRRRREAWNTIRAELEQKIDRARTLRRTTERQALDLLEKALKKAEPAFQVAFPRQRGQGYEEGQTCLASAREQVKRLRKKVKGY